MKRTSSLTKIISVLVVFVGGYLFCLSLNPGGGEVLRARENVLKQDLSTMRQAIDNYTTDNQNTPRSLQDLVDARYLREIPVDPITRKKDWIIQLTTDPKTGAMMFDDLHSNSSNKASDGSRYNTW